MGDIGMLKEGLLAWLLRREGGVVSDVVDHRGISSGLGVYRRRRGGRNSKYKAHRCITKHDMTICRTTGSNAVLHDANGEGKHWKGFSRHLLFPDRRKRGDGSMFSMLGACDR